MEDIKKISGAMEALLFIYGEPIEIKKLAELLEIEKEQAETALKDLDESLKINSRGLALIFQGSKIQLVTKPEFAKIVEKMVKEEYEENLTQAALETLSLVAYLGPIPRSQIDYFRGVNSSYILRNLMMRGLIEKVSDKKNPHIVFYQSSFDLLKHFGVSKIEELPDYEKLRGILNSDKEEIVSEKI